MFYYLVSVTCSIQYLQQARGQSLVLKYWMIIGYQWLLEVRTILLNICVEISMKKVYSDAKMIGKRLGSGSSLVLDFHVIS